MGPDRRGPPRDFRSAQKGEVHPKSCACEQRRQRSERCRPQALALVPLYAGPRISEIVALDVDDVARSARKGVLRILGKGERVRHVPIHPELRTALNGWLAPPHPGGTLRVTPCRRSFLELP